MPARAISAATKAPATPEALRLIQEISTRPATGSHTSPRIFFKAIATAWETDMGGSTCQFCNGSGSHGSGRTALCLASALGAC